MRSLLSFIVVASLSTMAFSQVSDPVVIKINGKPIRKSEFEYVYNKNNTINSTEKKSIDQYLDLFVNFKLKVEEAKSKGLDTTLAFRTEYLGYKTELSKPYLTDQQMDESVLKEAYQRYLHDINVSHILIRVPENASPEDTTKALKEINSIYKRLQKESFAKVAKEKSQDEMSAKKGGSVGFISVLTTGYPFENACYLTPLHSISKPFRTEVGYHILKVDSIRPSQGEVLVREIFRSVHKDKNTAATAASILDSLYARLKAGEDFATLASKYSDDPSASNGGLKKWLKPTDVHPAYSHAAFEQLQKKGQYSEPFQTVFGWHIIQFVDRREARSFDEVKDYLVNKIKSNERGEFGKLSFFNKLKKDYNFQLFSSSMDDFYKLAARNNFSDSVFLAEGRKLNKPLFKFVDKEFSQADFYNYIKFMVLDRDKTSPIALIEEKLNDFIQNQLLIYEQTQLDKKYPEFKLLMNEYYDGILLFEINNREVWEKSSKDQEGLLNYFNTHKEKYVWDKPHYKGRIIYCKDKDSYTYAQEMAKSLHGEKLEKYLQSRLNDSIQHVKIEKGLFAQGENKVIDNLVFKSKDPLPSNPTFPYVFVEGQLLKNVPDDIADVKGKVTTDYQEYLESEWVKTLRAKYKVEIDREVLESVKKN